MFLEEAQMREQIRKFITLAIQFKIPWAEMPDRIEEKIDFRPGPNTPLEPARQALRMIIEEEVNLRRIEITQGAIAQGSRSTSRRTPANRATSGRCQKCSTTFARSPTEIPLEAVVRGTYQGRSIPKFRSVLHVTACTASLSALRCLCNVSVAHGGHILQSTYTLFPRVTSKLLRPEIRC